MLDQRGPPISVTRSTIALLIAVSVLAGCHAGGRRVAYDETRSFPTENGAVVTLLDYLETGRQAAQGWLDGLPEAESSALAAAVARATEASVRLAALHDVSFWSYGQTSGSGILLDDGSGRRVVLTAAHTFDDAPESVRITTLPGRRCRATVRTQGRALGESGPDWALLDLDRSGSEDLPAVELGRAEVSELVFLLAYPDQCGVDGRGRIVRGDGLESAYLAPLVTFARVESLTPLVLVPVAGAIPLGGASGGGIFDREGGLVGIVSGVQWEPRRDTAIYSIYGCAVPRID